MVMVVGRNSTNRKEIDRSSANQQSLNFKQIHRIIAVSLSQHHKHPTENQNFKISHYNLIFTTLKINMYTFYITYKDLRIGCFSFWPAEQTAIISSKNSNSQDQILQFCFLFFVFAIRS